MATNTNRVPKDTGGFSAFKIIFRTIVNTSLRVFVPILVLFGVGAVIDFYVLMSKPIGMLVGTGVGTIIAGVLVYLQIRGIRK